MSSSTHTTGPSGIAERELPHASAATRQHETLVAVRGLGKCYEIYERPLDRLKQTLWRGRRQFYREFWALRDVSFELRRGEAIGIIGRNGSGKSTLLQMIAGTLRPTEGEIHVRGRVAALLELGSGFNYEFTGRENVYLNGTVLGLSMDEIRARFDEIAAFADIGEFLDQPVKTYSTGMVVRLAFAVQVLLEPDVLIVDEALAVGDAAFQIKCMNRMQRLIEKGVSVMLVTHDVTSVRTFCHRALWLNHGRLMVDGPPLEVTSQYLQHLFGGDGRPPAPQPVSAANEQAAVDAEESERPLTGFDGRTDLVRWGSGEGRVTGFCFDAGTAQAAPTFEHGGQLRLEIELTAAAPLYGSRLGLGFALRNTNGLDIITWTTWEAGLRLPSLRAGESVRVRCKLENILAPGAYALVLNAERIDGDYERHYYDFVENALIFRVYAARQIFSTVLPPVQAELLPAAAGTRRAHVDI